MSDSPRVTVVVPAFQASAAILEVLNGFAPRVDEVIVVDDESSDGTDRLVLECGRDNVSLLRHERNRGVGGAMKTGIAEALRRGADIVVKADADGQMHPDELDSLLEPLLAGEADCSKGNRWHDRQALRSMPWLRRWGNLGLSFLLRLASGHWKVFDPTNGYVAWRRELLERIDFSCVSDRYLFESSMLVESGAIGAVVADVGIAARYGEETSHLSVSESLLRFPPFLIRSTLRRLWQAYFVTDFNAVSLLLAAGTSFSLFALIFGGYHWWQSIRSGVPATPGTVILAALPLLFGFNCLLQALVLDISSSRRSPISNRDRLSSL